MLHRPYLQIAVISIATVWTTSASTSNRSEDQGTEQTSDIKCNVFADGIQYSTTICEKTSKTILKVTIDDQYTAVIPTSPPKPDPTTKPTMAEEDFATTPFNFDTAYDDWDYDYDSIHDSVRIVQEEKERHGFDSEEHFTTRATPWNTFCQEADQDDEEPLRITDGSFHPKYEVVPGLGVYRFHKSPRAWDDARTVCENEGAQLAVANSQEEADFLKSLHNRCPGILNSHFNSYQYLGVHDLYGEGKWETVAGDKLENTGYTIWAWGQPDNAHHFGEDCLAMNRYGYFNDVPCWTKLPFTCEHP